MDIGVSAHLWQYLISDSVSRYPCTKAPKNPPTCSCCYQVFRSVCQCSRSVPNVPFMLRILTLIPENLVFFKVIFIKHRGAEICNSSRRKNSHQGGPGPLRNLSSMRRGREWGGVVVRGGEGCVCVCVGSKGQPELHRPGEKITVIFLHTQIAGKFFVMNQSLSFSPFSLFPCPLLFLFSPFLFLSYSHFSHLLLSSHSTFSLFPIRFHSHL